MPTDFETYYASNPISVIDQNQWDDKIPVVQMQFQVAPVIYTPLVDWYNNSQQTGAMVTEFTEIIDTDVNTDDIPFTAEYIAQPMTVDSRSRKLSPKRYGDKVQIHESSNVFQRWIASGSRDWRPLLQGVLGNSIVRKIEALSRNAYLLGPKDRWTYGGNATSFATLNSDCKFTLDVVNAWNLRLGNTGTPVIPGSAASVKVAIVPPGAIYDFQSSLAASSATEAAMWRDVLLYAGNSIRYEIGSWKGVRFVEVPNDKYGYNMAVLYNAGAISYQCGVKNAISVGDGAPDPETTKVDETWLVGQKNVTHYIQLENAANMAFFNKHDWVSIHTKKTDAYGVTNGVDVLAGDTIVRRIVAVDTVNRRLSFDRPVMFPYSVASTMDPHNTPSGTYYAMVTKAVHVGMILVLGSRGGVAGMTAKPLKFYTPRPVDDFDSVWRYVWDLWGGMQIFEPNLFEVHFVAVSIAKPGGIITPESFAGSG